MLRILSIKAHPVKNFLLLRESLPVSGMVTSKACQSQDREFKQLNGSAIVDLLPQPLQQSRYAGSCFGLHEVCNNGYELGHGFGVHPKL